MEVVAASAEEFGQKRQMMLSWMEMNEAAVEPLTEILTKKKEAGFRVSSLVMRLNFRLVL